MHRLLSISLVSLLVLTSAAGAAHEPIEASTVRQALQMLEHGDPAGAKELLRAALERAPSATAPAGAPAQPESGKIYSEADLWRLAEGEVVRHLGLKDPAQVARHFQRGRIEKGSRISSCYFHYKLLGRAAPKEMGVFIDTGVGEYAYIPGIYSEDWDKLRDAYFR